MKACSTKGETQMTNFLKTYNGMNIERMNVKGVRWFQKSNGNTYHKAYISVLCDGVWYDIGSTDVEYGYGENYLCTAGKWLINNGYIANTKFDSLVNGYQLNSYDFLCENNIDHHVVDVQRKKDM